MLSPSRREGVSAIEALPQCVEALLPEAAVRLDPLRRVAKRRAAQARGPELRGAATLDQARALEDPQVLRDGLDRDRKRRGELVHGRLAGGEPGEDRAARRVRQGGEGRAQLVRWHIQSLA